MSTGVIIGVVIAIVVLLAAAVVVAQELSRARLRRQFGPEYTRLTKELGSQRKAEAELLARQKRAAKLNIRPLSAEQRTKYASAWTSVQEQFVDNPSESVKTASGLVERVMRDRGYPVGESQQMIAALSVYHARKLDHYRRGEDIRTRSGAAPGKATSSASTRGAVALGRGQSNAVSTMSPVSTEELREAILSYRELFKDLLDSDGRPPRQMRIVQVLDNVRIPIGR
jgi:hypothetical protein